MNLIFEIRLFLPQTIWSGLSCSQRINEIKETWSHREPLLWNSWYPRGQERAAGCVYMCVCGSSGGRKGMNSPQTLATQTEAFRAALISVQSVRGKYKRHCFSSKPTLKCGWTPPNTKNPISVPLLNIPSCNDDDLSAADKPRHCKHKAFFFFFS